MDFVPIAVVGMGDVFPGAEDVATFWRNIVEGRDLSREVPAGRWVLSPQRALGHGPAADHVASLRGCFVEGFELDPSGLHVDPALLAQLDPLYHFALHAARAAWIDGQTDALARRRTGVILASIALPTDSASAITRSLAERRLLGELFDENADAPSQRMPHPLNARVTALPASIVARALGLGGGSYTLDAACASSLYAVKLACDELGEGRADAMLAGGVSRPECLYTQMGFTQLRALSPSGRCAPFDQSADGLLVGEGAGVVLLKRLDDAIAANDSIYGVIRGIGLSNDVGGSLLAPDSEGQLRAMRAAYEQAGWSPESVELIECHGTGTPTGDAVEAASLRTLWQDRPWRSGQCVIGSVKSMIGHLLTGAGAAGLIKSLMAMKDGVLPPTANCRVPHRAMGLEDGPFALLSEARPWAANDALPRRAGVSAFGFGGINAHLLVEEYRAEAAQPRRPTVRKFDERVAIVGMEARFGSANGLRAFALAAMNGRDVFRPRAAARWASFGAAAADGLGARSTTGAFVEQLDIPVGKFRLPPSEIAEILPQQLLMLDVVAAALADARLPLRERRPRAGVIVGMAQDFEATNFHLRWWIDSAARQWNERFELGLDDAGLERWIAELREALSPALNATRTLGALGGMIASRIARECELGGSSFGVSSEQTSGITALHIAARALVRGELDMAIVGAVDLSGDLRTVLTDTAMRPYGDERPGEGAVAMVVKRFEDARRDGDRVYAVVDGVDLAATLPAGDDITRMIGRAGAATGLAAVARAAICLHHEVRCDGDRPTPWLRDRADGPRRAQTISESSEGGTAAVTLAQGDSATESLFGPTAGLFVLSGSDPCELVSQIDRLARLEDGQDGTGAQLARHWFEQSRRQESRQPNAAPKRLAIVARDPGELKTALVDARNLLSGEPQSVDGRGGVYYSARPMAKEGRLAFVFPGSGNHDPDLGRRIALAWPEVVRELDQSSERFASQWQPLWMKSDPQSSADEDVAANIFGQVSYGVVMSDLLRRFGVQPAAVIGYSLGESAGLFALRVWQDRDEMHRRLVASPLFHDELAGDRRAMRTAWKLADDVPVDWQAAVIARPAEKVRDVIGDVPHARLLIVNTPGECVVGGLATAVQQVAKKLGCKAIPLKAIPTVHFEAIREVETAYRELHLLETTPPVGVDFYSAEAGRRYGVTQASAAESITAQALHGFDFPKLVEQAYADGIRLFVEIGPQASCTRMISQILSGRPHVAVSASIRGEDETLTVLRLLAQLVANGVDVDLSKLYGHSDEALAKESVQPPRGQSIRVDVGGAARPIPMPPRSTALPESIASDETHHEPIEESAALGFERLTTATAVAHERFLRFSNTATQGFSEALAFQARLLETAIAAGVDFAPAMRDRSPSPATPPREEPLVALTREMCMEFAIGSVARVLGPQFAEVDAFATRVRLPDEPLMLVDRILRIEGEKGLLGPGRVVTEHDVLPGAWYLDGGRCPICITVEAGQADLFLSGYLGIDLVTRGLRSYRLLDATVTFHGGLPQAGQTILYDIAIDRFVRQGETYMFFFRFDGTIDGRPVLTMRNGCAGFFTPEEMASSHGIVLTTAETQPMRGNAPDEFEWPIERATGTLPWSSFDDAKIDALREGAIGECFGEIFASLRLRDPLRLPGGRMRLIHRVTEIDPRGGRFRLGRIVAEADVQPDDWYLTCHFVDDMVMPGTLMYECCVHTLRFFLLAMGWIGECDGVAYEPVTGVASGLKCRGPVTPKTKVVTYQIEVKEVGYRPEPYVIADALMFADGRPIVRMTDMSLQMTGLTRERIDELWHGDQSRDRKGAPGPLSTHQRRRGQTNILFDKASILAFSNGKPSEAFGEPYRIFDEQRRIARLPGPPYQFLDRITAIEPAPWKLEPGGWITAEYDVPPDAWYFAANRQVSMPFSILLEIALQPCGWLAAYLGSALQSDVDLSFRNLGGTAVLHREVFPDSGTLATRVKLTSASRAGGMIIEKFDMEVRCGEALVYAGDTSFGFFSAAALAQQIGIRDAGERMYRPTDAELGTARAYQLGDDRLSSLPTGMMRMIQRVEVIPDGGPHGLGFIMGSTPVDPSAWFFKAHFYQDPVWPGSLGLESFLQLLKVYAIDRWGEEFAATHRFEPIALGPKHTWIYRGQIIPSNRRVEVQAVVKQREDGPEPLLVADGFLCVDGRPIYEMVDFGLRMVKNSRQ